MKTLTYLLLTPFLFTTLFAEDAPILRNGDFQQESTHWRLETHQDAQGTLSLNQNGPNKKPALRITLDQAGSDHWQMSLVQDKVPVEPGKTYLLRFSARASDYRVFGVALGEGSGEYKVLSGKWDLQTEGEWKAIEVTLTSEQAKGPVRLIFGNLGKNPGWLELSGVELTLQP